ncbi:MAG: tRNA lysidine(34) synthetase TilS [Planctomycetota bacterium]|nr:MAG: tRNA lysidine(34) synthetase TilS [Planctomycetota bacterium]
MAHVVEEQLQAVWPLDKWRGVRVLVAVSGGADSVALLRVLVRLAEDPGRLIVAHFNHRWRGDESDADARWVERLAARLGLPCHVENAPEPHPAGASEESARHIRYAFLTRTAYAHGARYVVTAHTADDRVETLVHNLLRGSGIAGVVSLAPFRPLDADLVLARPLLTTWRRDVEDYLNRLGQPFRTDHTNSHQRYARNFLRHGIFPQLAERYGEGFPQRLSGFADDLAAWYDWVRSETEAYWDAVEKLAEYAEVVQAVQQTVPAAGGKLARSGPARADGLVGHAARWPSTCPHDGPERDWRPGDRLAVVVFPMRSRLPSAWPVVREALRLRWSGYGWSLGRLHRTHWRRIEQAWGGQSLGEPEERELSMKNVVDLPGGLRLFQRGTWLGIRHATVERRQR